jgi:outer membrane protein assembly factor BamD
MRRPALAPSALLLAAALCGLAGLAAVTAGCRSGVHDDPILRLAAAEALEQGKALMGDEKYARARRFLSHAFEVEPNSLAGREALLLLAGSYYLDGGQANWVQAEAKYRDFLNRFPTSQQASYAQFQIANSLAQRMEKPDRDQTPTRRALEAYQELLRLYPTSDYTAEARQKIVEVRHRLAEHEYVIGDFYLSMRAPASAVGRFEGLLESYPDYPERDKVLYHLGIAYKRSRMPEHKGKAAGAFERLRAEYPDSPYVDDIPTLPPEES